MRLRAESEVVPRAQRWSRRSAGIDQLDKGSKARTQQLTRGRVLARESFRPELFVVATGQDDNIGDAVLRREYFNRLREVGRLHLFVGPASADFLDALGLDQSDVVYASLRHWHSTAWKALIRGTVWFVDKPGELQLDAVTLNRQLKLLPLVLAVRARRGQVLRLGMAIKSIDPHYLIRIRSILRFSTRTFWRDTETSRAFGTGEAGPDWAFGWDGLAHAASEKQRPCIALSYRGDRDQTSDMVLEAIGTYAREASCRLLVVTQVRRDGARSASLARRLKAELVAWPDDRSMADQELVIREVYRDCALVISDRLHALIVGMTEGAVPLCITDNGEPKVGRHLEAVGFDGSTIRAEDAGQTLVEQIERQAGRREEVVESLRVAMSYLDNLTEQLKALSHTGHKGNRTL